MMQKRMLTDKVQQLSQQIVQGGAAILIGLLLMPFLNTQPVTAQSFSYWCANRNRVPPETQRTIDALLSNMGIYSVSASTRLNCDAIGRVAPRVAALILRDKNLSDLRPLSSFTNVFFLDLHNNQITDISSLAPLTSLEQLYLTRNRINNVQALRSMRKLKVLQLQNNGRIVDVSPLRGLVRLSTLGIDYYPGMNLRPLGSLSNLGRGGLELYGPAVLDPRACPFPASVGVCKPIRN